MLFIGESTGIPVPRVICSFTHKSNTFIAMERIDGEMLATIWPSLSESSRCRILTKLKILVEIMRELKPPDGFTGIANVVGGQLIDFRLPRTDHGFGPFETTQDFHAFLRDGLKKLPNLDPEVGHMIELQDGPRPAPVFTHGDLSSLNILVNGDTVVGIIDQKFAGWYPYY
jgi:aminoglycoside phosphotransferase (APT) family kinase protein